MEQDLIKLAESAREAAYSPYSGFCVGAALLCSDGEVYVGANVENASYGATICAERTAFLRAIMDGKRDFTAIAIVGSKRGEPITEQCSPCGICRQFMAEFCDGNFKIILSDGEETSVFKLSELFPAAFDKSNL